GMDSSISPWREPKSDPSGGATDVGGINWVVPTVHFFLATAPKESPWDALPVVAFGGMSIWHKRLGLAGENLAPPMGGLFQDPKAVESIQAEFREKTRGQVYKSYVPEGPPPLPRD